MVAVLFLILGCVLFCVLSYRKVNLSLENTYFDILSREEMVMPPIDISEFWGLTAGSLSLLTESEIENINNIVENIRYHSDIRKIKREKLVKYLVSDFYLNDADARLLVRSAEINARKHKIDVELLLAIIFVESTYQTVAESSKGAIGLMQIVPKWHLDKINQYGDISVLYDVRTNIAIGTEIFIEYLEKEGSLESALQRYNGSKDDKTFKYPGKVLKKFNELKSRIYMEDAKINYKFDIVSPSHNYE